MASNIDGSARIFASHYQLVVCSDVTAFTEASNWQDEDTERGFAGHERFRMIGTEADLNDHWVEALLSQKPPDLADWHRVICFGLENDSGHIHVMSVVDTEPAITLDAPKGPYSIYVAGRNLGVDRLSLGEAEELTDHEIARRKDLEWYRIIAVPGAPEEVGRLRDIAR